MTKRMADVVVLVALAAIVAVPVAIGLVVIFGGWAFWRWERRRMAVVPVDHST